MNDSSYWPSSEAFFDLAQAAISSDGSARCTGVALCDAEGRPARTFHQGQPAHFYYEFEILRELPVTSGGLLLRDALGHIVHGKNTFQFDTPVPRSVRPGMRLRYHHVVNMDLGLGEYWVTVGLASTDGRSYDAYRSGPLTHAEFGPAVQEHCRATDVGSFTVQFDRAGKLLHHGVANLPGSCVVTLVTGPSQPAATVPAAPEPEVASGPAILHVTHWKAGSQWIYKILRECAAERIVPPEVDMGQFLKRPVLPGRVYPTLYVTKPQFDQARLPDDYRRFVIIRDLRDTLVSAYYSIKISHPLIDAGLSRLRKVLETLSVEDGMIYLMDWWLPQSARIQVSWLEAGEPLLRYEDLLEHDVEILERVLLDEGGLPVSRERFREVVLANRFERLTRGRARGQEDVTAHERKGIAGDWRGHFTERLKQAFKTRYGGLLVATGYERDLNW